MAGENLEGQSFDNPALTGSGRIVDGEYVDSAPDPTEVRGLGAHKTSGGREVRLGGIGSADTATSPTSTRDESTSRQATSRTAQNKANAAK